MGAVSFEPIVGILRYHPKGGFGDPYTFSCTVVIDKDQATLKGAVGEYNIEVRRSIRDALISIGVKVVHFERRNTLTGNTSQRTIEDDVRQALGNDNDKCNGSNG